MCIRDRGLAGYSEGVPNFLPGPAAPSGESHVLYLNLLSRSLKGAHRPQTPRWRRPPGGRADRGGLGPTRRSSGGERVMAGSFLQHLPERGEAMTAKHLTPLKAIRANCLEVRKRPVSRPCLLY